MLLIGTAAQAADLPQITVIYPKPDQLVGAVDSTFILGHLPPDLPYKTKDVILFINGYQVPVHHDGGFLAFIPVYPGEFTFELSAYSRKEVRKTPYDIPIAIAAASVTVKIPEPNKPIPDDSLAIAGDYRPPMGDVVLAAGDRLDIVA